MLGLIIVLLLIKAMINDCKKRKEQEELTFLRETVRLYSEPDVNRLVQEYNQLKPEEKQHFEDLVSSYACLEGRQM